MNTPPALFELTTAITYVADDPRWFRKLSILTVVSAGALLPILWWGARALNRLRQHLTDVERFLEAVAQLSTWRPSLPSVEWGIVIGLAVGCAILSLGYYVQLIRNVRAGEPFPLPTWERLGEKMVEGTVMMLAYTLYIVLNLAVLFGMLALLRPIPNALLVLVLAFCGVVPFALVLALVAIFLTSITAIRYSETRRFWSFFDVAWVLRVIRQHRALTLRWFFFEVLANFGFNTVQTIPLLGILLTLTMQIPVQGHLLGQFARAMDKRNHESSPSNF